MLWLDAYFYLSDHRKGAPMNHAAAASLTDHGEGTGEAEWARCPNMRAAPTISIDRLVPPGRRAVIVAPHPDDEVLALGGVLAQLSRTDRDTLVVAVTDGDASHPNSSRWPPDRLRRERTVETERALGLLGFRGVTLRLGLPDAKLGVLTHRLAEQLVSLLSPHDVVFTTWRRDGHPDHEATGNACAVAVSRSGASLVEVPVWGWHWAKPADRRMPWHRAWRVPLDADAVRRKCEAVQAFQSQLNSAAATGRGPVLRRSTVARAARPYEMMFA